MKTMNKMLFMTKREEFEFINCASVDILSDGKPYRFDLSQLVWDYLEVNSIEIKQLDEHDKLQFDLYLAPTNDELPDDMDETFVKTCELIERVSVCVGFEWEGDV